MRPTIQDQSEKLKSFISPRRDIHLPVYNWHAFKHSYSQELVNHFITEFRLKKGSWVLDSFCGGGTTLLSCKHNAINSTGCDIMPFSVFLSKVKTRNYNCEKLVADLNWLREPVRQNAFGLLPAIGIIEKAYDIKIQNQLVAIMSNIELIEDEPSKDFFKLALLSILEQISQTTKAGGFLRLIDRNVDATEIHQAFLTKAEKMILDLKNCKQENAPIVTEVKQSDSRSLQVDREYDAIITSPPYPNRHDYTRIYALELIVGFLSTNDELKQLRYNTIRSHVEAKPVFVATDYSIPQKLKKNIQNIQKQPLNNTSVVPMLYGYFEDMFLSLKKIKEHLKPRGKVALVVSNVRFAGENVMVDEILSEIGAQVGLKQQKIIVARYRGNSAQQMKSYEKVASRESIVIWKK